MARPKPRRRIRAPIHRYLAYGLAAGAFALSACQGEASEPLVRALGDPDRGSVVVGRYACGSCHEIPGRLYADGLVGPPLGQFAQRTMIAGVMPNTPANLVRWLMSPQAIAPGNAMPDMGLSEQEARDVAAYLYTLR